MRTLPMMLLLSACGLGPSTDSHPIIGVVMDVEEDRVILDHEEIVGFMPAMTMPVPAGPSVLAKVRPGDQIRGRLVVDASSTELVDVEITGQVEIEVAPVEPGGAVEIGEVFPGRSVPASGGALVQIGEGQGLPTLLTFLFTTCPLPEYCPLLVTKLNALQDALKGEAQIVAVTLDPDTDALPVLEAYGAERGADPEVWRFARVEHQTLQELLRLAGVTHLPDEGELVHNIRILVLDAEGRLLHRARGNDWEAAELLEPLLGSAGAAAPSSEAAPPSDEAAQ